MTAAGESSARPVVGVVGLGIMGGGMARHLLGAGYEVVGYDVAEAATSAITGAGGKALGSPGAVADACDLVLLSLPSIAAFREVVAGAGGLGSAGSSRARVVADTSTMPLDLKEWARDELASRGVHLLDCTIVGTGAQMAAKDAVFYASGDDAGALSMAEAVLADCGTGIFRLGAFGNGTKLKLVANLLVTAHNAVAGEALALARHGGIEPAVALPALAASGASSRILELRGPMMVAGNYEPPTMKVDTFMKDVEIITAFAKACRVPVPVFAAAAQLHLAAQACGWGGADTASVHAIVERLSGA